MRRLAVSCLAGLRLFVILEPDRFLFAQRTPVVYVALIDGAIDFGLAPSVERALTDATYDGIAAVIFKIYTVGERADVVFHGDLIAWRARRAPG